MLRGRTSVERGGAEETRLSAGVSVRLLTCFYRMEQQRNSHKTQGERGTAICGREWRFRETEKMTINVNASARSSEIEETQLWLVAKSHLSEEMRPSNITD